MKVVQTKIGDVELYIESTADNDIEVLNSYMKDEVTKPTSKSSEMVRDGYKDIKRVLTTIAEDFGGLFNGMEKNKPESAELKLNFSMSGKASVWVLTGDTSASVNVTFNWKKHGC